MFAQTSQSNPIQTTEQQFAFTCHCTVCLQPHWGGISPKTVIAYQVIHLQQKDGLPGGTQGSDDSPDQQQSVQPKPLGNLCDLA
jgi:hypothetical protein